MLVSGYARALLPTMYLDRVIMVVSILLLIVVLMWQFYSGSFGIS